MGSVGACRWLHQHIWHLVCVEAQRSPGHAWPRRYRRSDRFRLPGNEVQGTLRRGRNQWLGVRHVLLVHVVIIVRVRVLLVWPVGVGFIGAVISFEGAPHRLPGSLGRLSHLSLLVDFAHKRIKPSQGRQFILADDFTVRPRDEFELECSVENSFSGVGR